MHNYYLISFKTLKISFNRGARRWPPRYQTLILGAVAYDPKVVTIWDGFTRYFAEHGLAFDYVLYSNYERQVEAQFAGDIDVAWNSPLAWLRASASPRAGRPGARPSACATPIAT